MSKIRPFKLAIEPCRRGLTEKGGSAGIEVLARGHNMFQLADHSHRLQTFWLEVEMVYRANKLAEVFEGRAVDMTGEGN